MQQAELLTLASADDDAADEEAINVNPTSGRKCPFQQHH